MVAIAAPSPHHLRHRATPRFTSLPPSYGLRRLAALVVVTVALALVALVADAAFGALSATPDGAPTAGADFSGPAEVVIVQPGDTLWSIAVELDPGADPRVLVDALADLNGSASIQAGQRLLLP